MASGWRDTKGGRTPKVPTLPVAPVAERDGGTDGVVWPTPCVRPVCGISGDGTAAGVASLDADMLAMLGIASAR